MSTTKVGGGTRERLLDEAERLLARRGVQGVTTREIVEAAEQRNPSAVTYHFGSRQNLLFGILARRGGPLDEARGAHRRGVGDGADVRALVACLVRPYTSLLESEGGRSYVRVVAQLRGRFAVWRVESDAVTTHHLASILDEIEERLGATPAGKRERVVALMMLLTATVAERARRIDDGTGNELAHDRFVEDLVDMCTAVVSA